jgi:hypothetical protein
MKRVSNLFNPGSGRRGLAVTALALVAMCAFYAPSALGDAGNPILGTIRGSIVPDNPSDPSGGVTVYVRGQWNWLSHNSDCNFDRAATGEGLIWTDPNSPGYTVTKGSVTAGVGVQSSTDGNLQDQMVHPVDRGNQVEGYTSGTWTSTAQGYTTNTAGDFPQGQAFADPTPPSPNSYTSWKGGCGREPLTATASKFTNPEATGLTCANNTTTCSGHPWGSWGYEKNGGLGYSHHFARRADVKTVCANFYDVHGGGKFNSGKFQLVNGAKEITVNGNADNSIQTNAFNANQGGNCVIFPGIDHTTAITNVPVGSNITDTAFIVGAASNQVTYVQFHLFAPGDSSCTGTDLYTGGRKSVTGSTSVTSDPVQANQAGDYHWTAELFDAATGGNKLAATSCGDTGETSHVTPAAPAIVTSASGPVTIGGSISDTALISGLVSPDGTGSITFTAYAPKADGSADTSCSTAVYTKKVTGINANGSYGSGSFTPSGTAPQIAGTYEWVASFSGDGNNTAASTKCGDNGEQSLVKKRATTVPTGQKIVISDFAKVASAAGTPTGTVNFQLYREPSSNCTANKIYDSGPVTLNANGLANTDDAPNGKPPTLSTNNTYSWLVAYTPTSGSGFLASTSACGTEQLTISGNTPGVDP